MPSAEEATQVVLSVLAAKTGYEPDMIEMDMALETEVRQFYLPSAPHAAPPLHGAAVPPLPVRRRDAARAPPPAAAPQLGVDSIKRVEILSDVQKELNVEAQDVAALSRTQTVGEVVEAMIKELGSAGPATAAVPSVAPTPTALAK